MDSSMLAITAGRLMAAKMFSLASCVMLFYDICLTFDEEVEKIWTKKFTPVTVLWFMNRYLSPLGYIVIIVSFHDLWPKSVCNRYVLYPEALKLFTSLAIGVIFILRLYAIYGGNRLIVGSAGALLTVQLGVKTWAFTDGTSLALPPPLIGCILVGKSPSGERFVYTWIAELVFDSVIFFATLARTTHLYRKTRHSRATTLIELIMRDGVIYFAVIFVANLVTVLIFLFAPPDLKAINASFSTLITSLMVSRLMLNLRGFLSDSPTGYCRPSRNEFQMQITVEAAVAVTEDDSVDKYGDNVLSKNRASRHVHETETHQSHWDPPNDWKPVKHVKLGAII